MANAGAPQPLSEGLSKILEDEGYGTEELNTLLTAMHPVDLAEFLQDLTPDDQAELFRLMTPERAAGVLDSMSHDARVQVAARLREDRLSPILNHLNPSTVADILPTLSTEKETRVLNRVDPEHREEIRSLRRYDPHTAGGLMTTNYVSVPDTATAQQTLQTLQGKVDAETIEYVYVVDDDERLRGVCTLRAILMAKPADPITSVLHSGELIFVGHTLDQEDVARIVQKYALRAVPVVDNSFRLIGVVTLDRVLAVIQHEASEDIFKMAGAQRVHALHDPVLRRVRVRLPWLGITVGGYLLIAFAIRGYEETLDRFLILSSFIPIIMAIGGNVGLQSTTLVVRGLATGEITLSKSLRVVLGEVPTGAIIGFVCGIVGGSAAYIMNPSPETAFRVSAVVFIAMTTSVTFGAAFGTLIPLTLHRFKIDPAVASGPFITTLNDMISMIIYLTLASVLLF